MLSDDIDLSNISDLFHEFLSSTEEVCEAVHPLLLSKGREQTEEFLVKLLINEHELNEEQATTAARFIILSG